MLTPEQQAIAAILSEARTEALLLRPDSCAALNSVIRRLAGMWLESGAGFDPAEFRQAANYEGIRRRG